jgi:hypothetical protein
MAPAQSILLINRFEKSLRSGLRSVTGAFARTSPSASWNRWAYAGSERTQLEF